MSKPTVFVRAPSRLHFGLFSFGGSGRRYGGVGVMIGNPSLELTIRESEDLEILAEPVQRVRQSVLQWADYHGRSELPRCRIEITSLPPAHAGLGTGTQLALAIAAGLNAIARLPALTAPQLATLTGRGQRSAVGTYGFLQGGLVVEQGKLPGESLSPLECRLVFPESWRFVLIRPTGQSGLSGPAEQTAFATLPPVAAEYRAQLIHEVRQCMVPALRRADFQAFSSSLYRYGRLAGNCFASCQGGPYNGPYLTELVDELRTLGIEGVGQSSWGPTLFALLPDSRQCHSLQETLCQRHPPGELEIGITAAANDGATVCRLPAEPAIEPDLPDQCKE